MPDPSAIKIDHLIRSKRRTIALQITHEGQLVVRAPLKASLKSIWEFITDKQNWILRIQQRIKQMPKAKTKEFKEGETFLFLGKTYELTIIDNSVKLIFADKFQLSIHHGAHAKQIFIEWYQQQALLIFTQRVQMFVEQYKCNYQKIKLSNAKTRWGSCSSKGNLNFSWRLIMAPLEVIDYVIAHELAHLKQMNHSKKFWQLVAVMCPQYQMARKWLRQHGDNLTI